MCSSTTQYHNDPHIPCTYIIYHYIFVNRWWWLYHVCACSLCLYIHRRSRWETWFILIYIFSPVRVCADIRVCKRACQYYTTRYTSEMCERKGNIIIGFIYYYRLFDESIFWILFIFFTNLIVRTLRTILYNTVTVMFYLYTVTYTYKLNNHKKSNR